MRHKVAFFVTTGGVALGTIINLVPPLLYREFFDVLATGSPQDPATIQALIQILVGVLGVFSVSWLVWRIALFTNNYFQPIIMRDLSQTCFNYLHKHSASYFNDNFVGSLVKRVNRYGRSFETITDLLTFNALRITIDIVIITIVVLTQNVYLALIIIFWVLVFVILNYIGAQYKLKHDIARSLQDTKTTGLLADTITNHLNVKFLNGYGREKRSFEAATERLRYLEKKSWDIGQMFETVQVLMMILLEFAIMYFAVQLWQQGLFSVGDFILIQSYVITIFKQLWDVGRYIRRFFESVADAEEMTEILEAAHDIVDSKSAKPLQVDEGEIVFENVTFRYNKTRTILSKLDLTIPGGQRVAFVGHSGAGKSTVTKLLLRMHDVSSGSIKIDGQKIHTVTLESLWQHISYVPQEPILFHRTLMENIRYGRPDATDAEVMEAAKLAHAHEFIETFQDTYDTFVGERGVKLSGGERQRVAIARAILKDAPILVLDEATSSLDSESEMYIQDALDTLMKGKTVIVIAHRLSTIMKMDRIVVMEEGDVIEDSTHKQLLRKKTGMYRRLWDLQAGEFIGE